MNVATTAQKKPLALKITIAVLIAVGLVGAYFLTIGNPREPEAPSTAELTISGSPKEFNLKVNGQDYGLVKDGETVTISATGSVELVASREGFADVTIPWQLSSANKNGVHLALEAQTDEAKAIVAEEQNLANEAEVGEAYVKDAEKAYKDYPILSDLPYQGNRFELYQGLANKQGYEFGLYLQLFTGTEDEGRTAFNAWMKDHGYDPAGYNVIEEIKSAKQSAQLPEPPTSGALGAITVDSITVHDNPELKERTADQLAQYFGLYTATWEPKEDGYIEYSEQRAKPLMAKNLADTVEEPYKPTITFNWQVAQSMNGRSYPWIQTYESTTKKGITKAKMEVCWAWIADEEDPVFDAPRELDVTVKDGKVQEYYYTDGDPLVDQSGTICDPSNR